MALKIKGEVRLLGYIDVWSYVNKSRLDVVIPYDENALWTVEAMRNIQDFLIKLLEVMKEEF